MSKKSKKKLVETRDLWPLIQQRLRKEFGSTEEQIGIIHLALQGYLPTADAAFVSNVFSGQPTDEEVFPAKPPEVTLLLEDGTLETLTITNHPVNQMYWYFTKRYGKTFGEICWAALITGQSHQRFYGYLGFLKKSLAGSS